MVVDVNYAGAMTQNANAQREHQKLERYLVVGD